MTFTSNLGSADRILRLVLGAGLIIMAATGTVGLWGYVGVVLVVTAFIKFCPVYAVGGFKTNRSA